MVKPTQKVQVLHHQEQTAPAKFLLEIDDTADDFVAYSTPALIDQKTPRSFAEATTEANVPLWQPAIDHKVKVHEKNGTWELVDANNLPHDVKLIGT